ncbi:MAG: T9SS type A sorting domain-containing protein [Flavobacteriales bacterium]
MAFVTALQAQPGTLDPAFTVGTGANNRVFAMAAQPDGQVVIGGSLTSYAGSPVGRLARLSRSGVLDAAFNSNIGTGAPSQINAVVLDADGRLLVGGTFSTFNGQAHPRLVRLNSDGTVDATFAIGSGAGAGAVTSIAVRPDGRILVAGSFTSFGGSSAGRIVQLLPNGARDTTFNTGTGANSDIYSISLDQQGRLVVGGVFSTFNGQSGPGAVRLLQDGSTDPTFSVGSGFNQAVFSCIHQRDGRIVLGGLFTTYKGVGAPRIVRLLGNGDRDTGFTPGTGFNSWVYHLALQGDGKILAGGDFTSFNGSARGRFVRLNTNGTIDTGFNTGTGFNNWVYASVWQPDGKITVAGGFTAFNGTGRNRMVRLNSGCDEELGLYIRTDAFGDQTSWELTGEGFSYPVCSGTGYASNADIEVTCCVPHGCYRFRLFDSAGDGLATGGYVLRDGSGERIIDNAYWGAFTTESSMPGNAHFCLPMSTQQAIFSSRDKLDWLPTDFVVAAPNAAVSAQWGVGDQTDDGYEFWFFDPNGSFSIRRYRNHATTGGYGSGASRACYQRLSWSASAPPLPEQVLLNLRIRARVNGQNGEWGPACRLMVDPVAANCPYTKLMDIPGHPFFSCGVTRSRSERVTARPVRGANRYQFEFSNLALGYQRTLTSTSYHRPLNWATDPLVPGYTYNVRVRISKDGGASWCSYGESCPVTIVAPDNMVPQDEHVAYTKSTSDEIPVVSLWPNPSNGRQVELNVAGLEGSEHALVTVHDLSGRVVHQQQLVLADGPVQTTLEFTNTLPGGQYVLRVQGDQLQVTERMIVAN